MTPYLKLMCSLFLLFFAASTFAAHDLSWQHPLRQQLSTPTTVYLLLVLGIYGMIFEFFSPGLVAPGVLGIGCLAAAAYAFHFLPFNYVGLLLLLAGIACMVAELYLFSFGFLALSGLLAFISGSFLLFDRSNPDASLAWSVIIGTAFGSLLYILLVLSLALHTLRKKVLTGKEGFIGQEGVVLTASKERTTVRVLGEIWQAKAGENLSPGQKIRITGLSGLELTVELIHPHH